MTTIVASISETDRLMASVGVGQWSWDGHNRKLTMDPCCKGLFEVDWLWHAEPRHATLSIGPGPIEQDR